MSKIKELFFKQAHQENRNVNKFDIKQLINYINKVGDEGTLFDAKDIGKILNDELEIGFDLIRTQLGKHISAMANTSGGLLAIGIKEKKSKKSKKSSFILNNYDLRKVNLQYIQRAITTCVEPKVDFLVELVEMEKTKKGIPKGIILLFIEQSLNPPHQVVHNKTYYFRHGESSEKASHALVQAMFHYRKSPKLVLDVIKVGKPSHLRVLIKNKGGAPAYHTHIVINIFPRLIEDGETLLNKRIIEKTTEGLWNIKSFLGTKNKKFMKFRFRADASEIILPEVNEVLFDFPFASYPNATMTAEVFCNGHNNHFEYRLY